MCENFKEKKNENSIYKWITENSMLPISNRVAPSLAKKDKKTLGLG